jgi:hypothetical protein
VTWLCNLTSCRIKISTIGDNLQLGEHSQNGMQDWVTMPFILRIYQPKGFTLHEFNLKKEIE